MPTPSREPLSLTFSLRLYWALLGLYPETFRQEYAGPMLQVFRDCCRRAQRENGPAGLLTLWVRILPDLLKSAFEEHAQRGVDMSKEKWIKMSGWGLMVGGGVMLTGLLAGSRPQYDPHNFRSLSIDRYLNWVDMPLVALGLLLLSAGFVGLILRYGAEIGKFGRYSLGFGAASGAVSALGAVGLGFVDNGLWWTLFFLGMMIQYAGMALFGAANLRRRVLPRWNLLPLAAGVWAPALILVNVLLVEATGGSTEMPQAVFLALWLVSLTGLAGVGYLLQSDPQISGTPAASA